jgi:hypothetical protein
MSIREESIGVYVLKAYQKALTYPLEQRIQIVTTNQNGQSMTSAEYHKACLGKISSWDDIETSRCYSPEKAREEFFMTFLRNSHCATLKRDSDKSSLVANFESLKEDETRQYWILQALIAQVGGMRSKPYSIILNHCSALKSHLLDPFLHEDLEILDLRYCPKIDSSIISKIQMRCPKLKRLSLSGCDSLTYISGSYMYPTVEFPHLEHLDFNRCPRLYTVQVKGLSLKTVEGKHNPQLGQVNLTAKYRTKTDFKESPEVELTIFLDKPFRQFKRDFPKIIEETTVSKLRNSSTNILLGSLYLPTDSKSITALTESEEGNIISGHPDGRVILWHRHSTDTGVTFSNSSRIIWFDFYNKAITSLALLPNGQLAIGTEVGSITIVNFKNNSAKTIQGHTQLISALIVHPDGSLISGSYDGMIKIWDSEIKTPKQSFRGSDEEIDALAILKDETLVIASQFKVTRRGTYSQGGFADIEQTYCWHELYPYLILRDCSTGTLKRTLESQQWGQEIRDVGRIRNLVVDDDSVLVCSDSIYSKGYWIWDPFKKISKGMIRSTQEASPRATRASIILKNGNFVTGFDDGSIQLWQ